MMDEKYAITVILKENLRMGKTSAPKGEMVWVSYWDSNNELKYITTSKIGDRTWYYLYEIKDGKQTKISKSKNPNDFNEITLIKKE
jgi:hypothetical protein